MKNKQLKRQRINRILSTIYDYPLTIVEAPMGFGKTTAVRSFLASDRNHPLWVTPQNSGQDASFLWHQFAVEIGKLDKIAGRRLKSLGIPVDAPQTAKALSILNRIEFPKRTVLVIDDYHLISNMRINHFVLQVAMDNIENLHVVIITRDTTNIDFMDMYSKAMCHIISQQQLKFSDSEIRDYCLTMIDSLSEVDLNKISEYTDGWISLIYMILVGLNNGIPVGLSNTIDELLEKALCNSYDVSIRDFMLKLSIMESFTQKQAAYVTGEENTQEILKKLHKENAFVYYDEAHNVYKIHNVLLDFLRSRQDFKAEELRELYRRLGEWYLDQEEFATGYKYLNRAGATERILSHLNDPSKIRQHFTNFEGSFEMFNGLPLGLLHQYPIAYLQHILISIVRGNASTILECSKRLDELQQAYELMGNIEGTYRNRIIAEIIIMRKLARFNHIDESTTDNDMVLRLLNGEQSYIMRKANEFTFGSPHLLYVYFREQGTFNTILGHIVKKFVPFPKYANGCGAGSEYLALAEYELETGDWQVAELNSYKAIYKAKTKTQNSVIICAKFNLIRLYILQGKVTKSLEMLREMEEEIMELDNSIYNTTIDICKGYIYASVCQHEKIPLWLQIGDIKAADVLYQGIAFSYIVYGKAVMAFRKYTQLEMLSESFVENFSMFSNQLGFIHNSIFEAVAKYQLYGMETGVAALQVALAKGQADDIIMPFVENAPHIIEMLEVIAKSKSDDKFVKRVLLFSNQYNESLRSSKSGRVMLTQREREVLTLAAEGLKREEIALRLYMSPGTVKTHFQNIYQKLDASGKVSAIKIAQMNGLI